MRKSISAFRSRSLYGAAFVVLVAGISAGCTNSQRLGEPFFTGSTANQRDILGSPADQTMPGPIADHSVTRTDLLPPPTYVATSDVPTYDADGQSVYGWSAVGGQVITVAQGETLDNIAVKFGVPGDQILNANQLTSAGQVRPGQVLVIPRRVAMAPDRMKPADVAATAPAVNDAPMGATQITADTSIYVVKPGDTLFSVARRSGMKPSEIAALNGIATDTQLQIGQKLRLNGSVARTSGADAPTTLGAPEKPLGTMVVSADPKLKLLPPADSALTGRVIAAAPQVPPAPSIPVDRQATAPTTVAAAAVDEAVDAASSDGKSFRWPVRGRIISGFGAKPNGERNDGINLAVPEGTSVKAVELGTVIYAGNELEGYGNLVLVRHADGWVSAYAHNKDVLVKRGDKVNRGQTIARAGMTGSVSSPQVHFELRQGAKPVNPLDYLAGA